MRKRHLLVRFQTSEVQLGEALDWDADPGGGTSTISGQKLKVGLLTFDLLLKSPALLSLQELPVGGDLHVQGKLDIE